MIICLILINKLFYYFLHLLVLNLNVGLHQDLYEAQIAVHNVLQSGVHVTTTNSTRERVVAFIHVHVLTEELIL